MCQMSDHRLILDRAVGIFSPVCVSRLIVNSTQLTVRWVLRLSAGKTTRAWGLHSHPHRAFWTGISLHLTCWVTTAKYFVFDLNATKIYLLTIFIMSLKSSSYIINRNYCCCCSNLKIFIKKTVFLSVEPKTLSFPESFHMSWSQNGFISTKNIKYVNVKLLLLHMALIEFKPLYIWHLIISLP